MSKLDINNDRMEQFIETITAQVREAMRDRSDAILKSWQETISEAVENQADFPKLKLGFATVVDLECSEIKTALKYSTAYKCEITTKLPDPNQPEFELNPVQKAAAKFVENVKKSGASVTITAGDKGVEISDGKVTPIETPKKKK